jgi:hypothetical protein
MGHVPAIRRVALNRAPNERTDPKSWRERDGAPQRPPELFGAQWFWYNDPALAPALAKR